MITGHSATRQQFLSGDVTPSWALTVRNSHLDWTWEMRSVQVSGVYEGDDQHVLADIHFPWGDGAVVGPTNQWGWAWSPRQWNATDTNWYIGIANNAVFAAEVFGGQPTQQYTLSDGPLLQLKSRPGVWGAADSSVLRVFYITQAGSSTSRLTWSDVDLADLATAGGVWCGSNDGVTCDLYDANNVWLDAESYTVAPVSATEVFVFGYASPLVWVCRFVYAAGSWTAGVVHYVKFLKTLPYNAIFNCDAVALTEANQRMLLAPTAARTVQALTYTNSVYSAAYWLHAPPETSAEGGQRVWVHSLNFFNARVWAVLSTDVDGGQNHYYARRTHLYSAGWPGGWDAWRDEGVLCQGSWPGKAELAYGYLSCRSAASWAYAPETWRLTSTTATGVTGVTAVRSLNSQRALQGPAQLEAELLEFCSLLEPGNRMDYSLGVGSDKVPIFTGYIDAVSQEEVLGETITKVLARGPLSRLTGETSFVPLTTLAWGSRQSWWTRFVSIDKTAVNGLVTAYGDLWAERLGNYGVLRCRPSAAGRPSIATAPVVIDSDDCVFTCVMQVDQGGTCGVTFWHDDPDHLATAYWLVDLVLGTGETYGALRLWQVTPGVDATGADIGIFTLKQTELLAYQNCTLVPGDKIWWNVLLRSGFVQVSLAPDAFTLGTGSTPVPPALLIYDAWQPAAGELFAPAPGWLVGVSLTPVTEGQVYEFGLCDSTPVLSVRDALEAVSELSGVALTWPTSLAIVTPGNGVTVQALDCTVTPTNSGSGLVIGDYTLTFQANYATLSKGTQQANVFYGCALSMAEPLRVIATEQCLTIYHSDRLLCAFYVELPEVVGFVTVHGDALDELGLLQRFALAGRPELGVHGKRGQCAGQLVAGPAPVSGRMAGWRLARAAELRRRCGLPGRRGTAITAR